MSERYQKYGKQILEYTKSYRLKNKVRVDGWAKWNRRRLRKEVIEAYGGECECCGEKEWKFLTLDHPDGKGQEDRAKHIMKVGQIYAWVKSQGFPKGYYRLLCMNCNWIRRYDTCPHEDAKNPNYQEMQAPEYKPKFLRKKEEKPKREKVEPFVPTLVKRKKVEELQEMMDSIPATPQKEKDPTGITRAGISKETYQKDEWVDPI